MAPAQGAGRRTPSASPPSGISHPRSCRARKPRSSRGVHVVLVHKSAKEVPPTDLAGGRPGRRHWTRYRHVQVQSAMRPLLVVVDDVSPKDALEVTSREDQRPGPGTPNERSSHPDSAWVTQQGRNLAVDGRLEYARFLIRDRDSKYSSSFDEVFRSEGGRVIRTPVRAPRANEVAERWVGSDACKVHALSRARRRRARRACGAICGLHGEEVAGPDASAWERRNSVQEGPSRRGAGPIPARRRIDLIVVAPSRIPSSSP